jgi:hydroxymethylpyrimidine kinase/phosphomethylpyrimidine kinase
MKNDQNELYPAAMTIAGSDSSGGAGIQADLRSFAAFGVYGCSAITAITSQNPHEVTRIDAIPIEGVNEQINAVASKISLSAVKTGMLFNADIIRVVAEQAKKRNFMLIVDPVMVSTSGARLLEENAVSVLMEELLPLAAWITPNIPEAEILTGMKISGHKDMIEAARLCSEKWDCGCILKAGHCCEQKDVAADIVAYQDKIYELSSPRLPGSKASHGTGCTFSAALTASFALGFPWKKVLRMAKGFVFGSLAESVTIGKDVEAMYPPTESYQGKTLLVRIEEQ